MLTRDQARQLTAKILKFSKLPECTVNLNETEDCYVRFANNGVTTSGFTVDRTVTISSTRDGKTGVTRVTELDDAALEKAVRTSEQLAEIAPANPERVEPLGPQKYADHDNWDEGTATARSPQMVPHVKAIIDAAAAKKLIAAGFFNRTASIDVSANKKENFLFERSTDSRLTTTVRAPDGSSSGWAGKPSVRIAEIDGKALGLTAVDKCLRWVGKPMRPDPGKYTVVLEPSAVAYLLANLAFNLNARAAEEGRSFLSKKGGGTMLGEKMFPELITLRTDPFDRRHATQLSTLGGLPSRPVTWIEKGVVKNMVYDRYWAMKAGKEPTSAATSLILEGGDAGLADLVKGTEHGLLVTRFWYVRMVNPQTVQLTGLTRDGLFLIEKGEITRPVMNLRFNESPVRMLQNTVQLGRSDRAQGAEGASAVVPPLRVKDFTFSSISDAV